MIVKSRQDTYQYTHDQKQAGFSADVGFDGKPQSFSINGGRTDVDADYAQVTHQSGIKAKESTLSVQGQGKFTGGYLITDAGKNQTQFAQGIQTQDIENHLNYEGDAISVGIGNGSDTSNTNGKAKPALQGLGYGTIDPVNKTNTTHAAITDQAGLSHINTENFKQEEVQHELNQIITNDFDKEQALTELGAQVNITTEFDNERRAIRSEFAKKAEDYRKQAEELPQGSQERTKLEAKAKQIDDNLRLFDGITSALYAPNSNGIIGDTVRAASPQLAYRIGQEFKRKDQEGSAQHLLAHAILGAAVSYATGNDIATGALSGATSEATAPILATYLYGKDPQELTQEQKDTIVSILNLATVTTAYTATDGSTADAVSAAEVGKVGVEWNNIIQAQFWKIEKFVKTPPVDAVLYSYQGIEFYAPPFADFVEVYQAGAKNAKDNNIGTRTTIAQSNIPAGMIDGVALYKSLAFYNTMDDDVGHLGKFDYQRDYKKREFISPYTDAANFAVGVYLAGTGLSYDEAMKIPTQFANLFSSNAGDPAQRKFWDLGWQAAKSGHLRKLGRR